MTRHWKDKFTDAFNEIDDATTAIRTIETSGSSINPLARYVEMTETSATVETYEYYESSNKVTLYNTIVVTYTDATKAVLASVEWS